MVEKSDLIQHIHLLRILLRRIRDTWQIGGKDLSDIAEKFTEGDEIIQEDNKEQKEAELLSTEGWEGAAGEEQRKHAVSKMVV